MAVTARFQADFSTFTDAVVRAQVQMADLSKGADRVGSSLNRMVDQFSGRRLIQEATLMTQAIGHAGGVSKLTGAELEAAGNKAAEAVAKMRRLGIEVPPGLQNIANAATQSRSALAGLAGQLAGMFSIGAVIAFGRSVLQAGDSIQKMADQTDLSIANVQKLQYVSGQTGSSIQSLVGAVQILQQRLGDDNTGAAAAMRRLGINADEFNKLDTYEQVLKLSDALRQETDVNQRAVDGTALFGRTWKEVGPAIKANMREIGDQAPIMADETVESLDRIGDAMARSKAQATAWGGAVILAIEGVGFAIGDYFSQLSPSHFGIKTSELLKGLAAQNDPQNLAKAFQAIKPPILETAAGLKSFSLSAEEVTRVEEVLNRQLRTHIEHLEQQARAIREVTQQKEDWRAIWATDKLKEWQAEERQILDMYEREIALLKEVAQQRGAVPGIAETQLELFPDRSRVGGQDLGMQGLAQGTPYAQWVLAAEQLGPITQAASDASSVWMDVLGNVQQRWAQLGTVAVAVLQKIITWTTAARASAGDWVGLLASAVVTIISMFGKVDNELARQQSTLNQLRNEFIDAYGPEIEARVKALGNALADELLKIIQTTDNAEALKRALKALEEQFKDAEEQARKYAEQTDQLKGSFGFLEDRIKAGITTQEAFNVVGLSAVAMFEEYVKRTGDLLGAFDLLNNTLTELEKTQKEFGFATNEAVQQLLGLNDVVQANKDVLTAMQANVNLMRVMNDLGIMTGDIFKNFGLDAVNQFNTLINRGVEMKTAFVLMQPALQQLWEAQKKFGLAVDDATQSLINEAVQMGIVGEDSMSWQNQLLNVLKELRDVLAAAAGHAGRLKDNLTNMPTPGGGIGNIPSLPSGFIPAAPMAEGGVGRVTKPTLFFSRGNEDFAFSGEGKRFGGKGGEPIVIHNHLYLDGREVSESVIRHVPSLLSEYGIPA